ncbi:MAG: threonine synthase [Desulfitobacteriaceae bacterium]
MYESTRGNLYGQSAKQAIALGMVPGGGLFVPTKIPVLAWEELREVDYPTLARRLMGLYLPDFESSILDQAAQVYAGKIFDETNPAPLREVGDYGVLELWHGPTAAFKDMALQVLPYLLSASLKSLEPGSEVLILTATSGDTGKAALEGFRNVPGTHIVVFYPDDGVSVVQERQMTTTDGKNTYVVAVKGNFDQCQTSVKEIFASSDLRERLKQKKMLFSSANSINWGRLLPQIVYYYWAYLQAVAQDKIKPGAPLNIAVPTGNFGNILAGLYAKEMGLPLGRLICASNKNRVLSDFFTTGQYESKRPFFLTVSPSMDILISSNFERFLFEMTHRDTEKIRHWYGELAETGAYRVDEETLAKSRENIYTSWTDEDEVLETIRKSYQDYGYVFDPHTAVAANVFEGYRQTSGDDTFGIIMSTASPFKFATSVFKGITKGEVMGDEWEAIRLLSEKTGWEVPHGLKDLEKKPVQKILKCQPEGISALLTEKFDF